MSYCGVNYMKILGIETSCDETAVCLIDASGEGASFQYSVLGNALLSQAALHAQYGGVFPNLAKREHAKNLVPLLEDTLRQADMLNPAEATTLGAEMLQLKQLLEREEELFKQLLGHALHYQKPPVDCIAVTAGPGLEPALWVGINFAKALSMLWNVPIVAVNHMEGHVVMPMMEVSGLRKSRNLDLRSPDAGMREFGWPVLSLLISGGHTELVLSKSFGEYQRIGETRDDAAGEAFDKVARLMDLPYPGGPEISKLANVAREKDIEGDFTLTRPMLTSKDYDFSFSGLKNAVRLLVEKMQPLDEEKKMTIAREFEDTVADVLISKTLRAAEEHGVKTIVVGGGVSANIRIRELLAQKASEAGIEKVLAPSVEHATDNALMIAIAGYFHAVRGGYAKSENIAATGNLRLESGL